MRTTRFHIQMPIPSLSDKTLLSAVLWSLLFLSLPTVGRSQVTTGDLLGTITDSTGALVQNASITVTNLETHETRRTKPNAAGEYDVTLLPAGHYSVTVSSTGTAPPSLCPLDKSGACQ